VANDILNKFKSNPDSWLVVDRILQQALNPNTKFFALQILEEAVNVSMIHF
jgi:exportin-1